MPVEEKVGTDLEILRELDFTPATPCQWRTKEAPICPNDAHWAVVCKTCAQTNLVCSEHRERVLALALRGVRYQCTPCGASGVLTSIAHIVPWGRS